MGWLEEFWWGIWKVNSWSGLDGSVVNVNVSHSYTPDYHTGGTSWNPVAIGTGPVDCDPKQLSITRAELSSILSWVTTISWLNFLDVIIMKVVLYMCCDIKVVLKGLQKWLGSHITHKMWKKPNYDTLNEIKKVLFSLLLITFKSCWVKYNQDQDPNIVMEATHFKMDLQAIPFLTQYFHTRPRGSSPLLPHAAASLRMIDYFSTGDISHILRYKCW